MTNTLLLLLLAVSVAQAALMPRALWQFGKVIKCAVSTSNPLKHNDYGCWCGFGGSGTPVDQVDHCCKAHDLCYRESRRIAVCRLHQQTGSNTACQKFICDHVAAHCFSQAPYNEQFQDFDKKQH
ncbi:phospholipase A2-like [Polyodon spathula]|uniref:phospholipase A2-like n=1 Tax=Polyodon spathula TaxID=7913 RepID=UPI001B7E2B99|nr:phospholipase A2-like [Polyodon spathula]